MCKKQLITSVILIGLGSSAFAQDANPLELIFSLENRTFTEPTSIDSFIHEFEGDLEFGEYAFVNNTFELGVKYSDWTLSYIDRLDHFYTFSNDTASFYYEIENNISQPLNEPYNLALNANHLKANGFKLRYDWQFSSTLSLNASASYLQAKEFYAGQLQGTMALLNNNSYSGQLNMNLLSHRDVVLEFPISQEPKGTGYALDFGLSWAVSDKLSFDLELQDAFSQIDWDSSLETIFNATTAVRAFDSNGQLTTTPSLSGRQILRDSTQELPEKLLTSIQYQLTDKQNFGAEVFHTQYFTHSTLAYGYSLSEERKLKFSWGLDTQSIGIEYQNSYGRFGIETDTLDYEDAHTINLIFELNVSF